MSQFKDLYFPFVLKQLPLNTDIRVSSRQHMKEKYEYGRMIPLEVLNIGRERTGKT